MRSVAELGEILEVQLFVSVNYSVQNVVYKPSFSEAFFYFKATKYKNARFAYYLIGATCCNRELAVNDEKRDTQLEKGNAFVWGDMSIYNEQY